MCQGWNDGKSFGAVDHDGKGLCQSGSHMGSSGLRLVREGDVEDEALESGGGVWN